MFAGFLRKVVNAFLTKQSEALKRLEALGKREPPMKPVEQAPPTRADPLQEMQAIQITPNKGSQREKDLSIQEPLVKKPPEAMDQEDEEDEMPWRDPLVAKAIVASCGVDRSIHSV